jgi:hypothetical protein
MATESKQARRFFTIEQQDPSDFRYRPLFQFVDVYRCTLAWRTRAEAEAAMQARVPAGKDPAAYGNYRVGEILAMENTVLIQG